MARFTQEKKAFAPYKSFITSVIIFALVLFVFLFAVGKSETSSSKKQKETLENAIDKSLVSCYILEGRYPENFAYLEENYGITYDKKAYRVDYQVFGSNIKPNIDIVELEVRDE